MPGVSLLGRARTQRGALEAEESNPRATALYAKAGYEFLDRRLLTKRLHPGAGYKAPPRAE